MLNEWFKDNNLEPEIVEKFQLTKINVDKHQTKQIRIGGLIEENLSRIREAVKSNVTLPPLIVVEVMPGNYEMIDGLHRYNIFGEVGRKTHPVWVLKETNKLVIEMWRRTANNYQGVPPCEEERIEQAVALVQAGYKIVAAAQMEFLQVKKVQKRMRLLGVYGRLTEIGFNPAASTIAEAAMLELHPIRSKKVLGDAYKLASEAGLTASDTRDLRVELLAADGDEEIKAVMSRWNERFKHIVRQRGTTGRTPSSPYREAMRYTKYFDRLQESKDSAGTLSETERRNIIKELRRIAKRCQEAATYLERLPGSPRTAAPSIGRESRAHG